ncbi:hypothetical protein H4R99_008520, partial [Coemansia sp. RSA 1722]
FEIALAPETRTPVFWTAAGMADHHPLCPAGPACRGAGEPVSRTGAPAAKEARR